MKKIICYIVQNRITLDKEDFYNVKGIATSNVQVMNGLIEKLVRYTVEKYGVGAYQQNVNMMMVNDENVNVNSNRMMGECN